MPLYTLNKQGIDAEKYFSKVLVTGSHENAVMAVWQARCRPVRTGGTPTTTQPDADAGQGNDEDRRRQADEEVDDFRIILKSAIIINSPTAYLDSLPEDLKGPSARLPECRKAG